MEADPSLERTTTEEEEEREELAGGRTILIDEDESSRLRSRWESIQASFIDEPRESVTRADELVEDLIDRITEGFDEERSELERTWERGEEVDTETLRITLQRYRTFFERLLTI